MALHDTYHDPVLAAEVVATLVQRSGIYVDGTLGGGSHSLALLQALQAQGLLESSLLIGIDQDSDALAMAAERLQAWQPYTRLLKGNFRDMASLVQQLCDAEGRACAVTGVLLDLGVSSFQLDTAERGFSYMRSGPLDMRMDNTAPLTAAELINHADEAELARIFYHYGEEPRSRALARAVVQQREKMGNFTTTEELAALVRRLTHGGEKAVIKTLSRLFQALRIAVNDELGALHEVLEGALELLDGNGRLAVMSYHSLEDRVVKHFFTHHAQCDWGPKGVALREPLSQGALTIVTKRPMLASADEIERNPRARSAKLRVAAKNQPKTI
uniref:Ribosomal RNA small subunit methyltransferase H n=1 Tax=Chlorobium chlorochromatii (strain CaD3) TaxID=340177 RepID=RSMH_CHLCH|nr:RecName: Full=Ribosomal RNA small subunit methyltransferase H; AltName: Full=16S rRNA m(4)C1402 methyltransferase; AltName: Full=rRNA (cytosine-N(4)-)-methyltransferase RsmH [Chlorobium chlorochromatii CaD3]